MPAIYHEGSWLGNATDPEVLVKDTVGWTGKNLIDVSKTVPSKAGATITNLTTSGFTVTGNNVTYGASRTPLLLESGKRYIASVTLISNDGSGARMAVRDSANTIKVTAMLNEPGEYEFEFTYQAGYYFSVFATFEPAASGSVTVDNVMIRRADITDSTYEPYHESVETMYEEEVHGVNLLRQLHGTETKNGVTFTQNTDGSVTVNGTATVNTGHEMITTGDTGFNGSFRFPVGRYILSGCPKDGSWGTYSLYFQMMDDNGTWLTQYKDEGNGVEFEITETNKDYRFIVSIRAQNGVAISNVKFYPMIRKADIEDSTYRPYNHQAIQNQLNAQGVLGAKNLLDNTATSQTINGLTFTVNNDKSVTVNGTATATTNLALEMTPEFDGAVILSGCPSGGAANKYSIQYSSWVSGVPIYADYGEGVIIPTAFNKSTYPNARIFINITNGQTISNLTFRPMLRLASDPDDTYQPYAMTNRELTEKVDNLDMFKKDIRINQTTGETLSSMLDRMLAALISYIRSLNTNYYVFLESLSIPGYDTISPERLYIINPSSTWTASEIMFSRVRATASDIKINSVAMYASSSNYYRGILKYDGSAGSVNNIGSNTDVTNITLRMMVFKQYG